MTLERFRVFLRGLAFALPLLSISYLIRFRVAGLPSTLLEILLLVFIVGVFIVTKRAGLARAHTYLVAWRWPLTAWLFATVVAVFVAPSLWTGLGLWRAYILEPMLVLLAMTALLDQPGDRRRMEWGMMGAAIVVSAWALVGYLGNWGIPHPWNVAMNAGRRAVGPFGFPNAVALFVAPIGALAAARFASFIKNRNADATKQLARTSLKEAILPALTLISVAMALLLAKSDGGMIAFGFVIVLALLGLRWGRWLVVLGGLSAALALVLLPDVRHAIVQELTFQGWSGKVRLIMWRETWMMLKDHWFFGAGFGGYPIVFDAYHKARFIEIFQYPHTILFNLWSETGLLGIAAFISVGATWFHQSLLASRRLVGAVARRGLVYAEHLVLLAPLLAILVQGLVDVPYFKNDSALLFWLFVWLIVATKQEAPKLA